jgi:heme exporter protein CcmD
MDKMMTLHFAGLKTFLQMGGYAVYVWSAYALVMGALCINALLTQRQFKAALRRKARHATDPQT